MTESPTTQTSASAAALPAVIDGIYQLGPLLGEGGMAVVHQAEVDLDQFDYSRLYAYTQVGGDTQSERWQNVADFQSELASTELDQTTVRSMLKAHKIPLPNQQVAIKILKPKMERDRFEAEWKNLLCLSHENVIKVYGGGDFDGCAYFTMELLQNIVDPAIIKSEFSLQQKLELIIESARGLGYLHDHGILHRDVKPSNLVTCEISAGVYQTKVADLGIAKNLDGDLALTQTNTWLGTPYYMSPEQIASSRDVDHRTDIYSLGASLYQLLAGIPPYANKTSILEIVHAVSQGERPTPATIIQPTLPGELGQIIQKAMASKADKRYTSMTELADTLQAFIDSGQAEKSLVTALNPAAAETLAACPETYTGPPQSTEPDKPQGSFFARLLKQPRDVQVMAGTTLLLLLLILWSLIVRV